MIDIADNFVSDPQEIRQSAILSGFGTWNPGKGQMGASFYEGVSFWGDHSTLFKALHQRMGQIIPSSMFFRLTNPGMEHALIHSDREYGEVTSIVYLSESPGSGTGFYRHRETGWTEMPSIGELLKDRPFFDKLNQQILDADDKDWELYYFVEAKMNRCLSFDAPKIHCRHPKVGYGTDETDSRMVWVCHWNHP